MGLSDMFKVPGDSDQRAKNTSNTSFSGKYTYRLNKAKLDARTAREKLAARIGKRDLLLQQRGDAEKSKKAAEDQLSELDQVQILLQKASDYARLQIKKHIEDIVSQALNVVYGGEHRFIIDLQIRSNRPEVDYWLDDGEIKTQLIKPDYGRGGGKIDVISFSLRLAIAELMRVPGPIFMDEVGKHIDAEAVVNMAYFIKQYSEKFDRQMILATHNTELEEIGEINLRVSRKNGIASVKKI